MCLYCLCSIFTLQVKYTYYWSPITNTDLTLCFVEALFDHSVFITPEYAIAGCVNEDKVLPASLCSNTTVSRFRYHTCIKAQQTGVCEYFKKVAFSDSMCIAVPNFVKTVALLQSDFNLCLGQQEKLSGCSRLYFIPTWIVVQLTCFCYLW